MNHDDFISYGPGSLWQFKSHYHDYYWSLYNTPIHGRFDTETWAISCITPILFLGKIHSGIVKGAGYYKVMAEYNGEMKIGWIKSSDVKRLTRLKDE